MSQNKRVPKYSKHASGQAFVKHRGKQIYLGKYGTDDSRARYRRFLEQLEYKEEFEPIDAGSPAARPVVKLIALYLEYCSSYYVDSAGKQTKEYTSIDATLADVDVVMGDELSWRIGPGHFVRLQHHLIGKGYCRNHINKVIGRAKRMFRWACNNELCPPEVYHRLACVEPLRKGRTKAKEGKKVRPVARAVFEATLPWMSPVVADMARVQLSCGMRPSEVCRMRGADIDRTGDVWIYRPDSHKGAWRGHERLIAVPADAQEILRPYLGDDPEAWLFSPRKAEKIRNDAKRATAGRNRKTKCYPSELRRLEREKAKREKTNFTRLRHCYDANSYRRAVDYAIERAKRAGTIISPWFPYMLRHTAATEVAAVLGQTAAARWLGHQSLSTTDVYIEQQIGDLIETARQLESRRAPTRIQSQRPATACPA